MAYTVVYGSYSASWTPSGSSLERKVRARLYYEVTPGDTVYTIKFYGQGSVYNDNISEIIYGRLYNDTTPVSYLGSHTYTYNSSGTNHTEVYYPLVNTYTITVNRTTSQQKKKIQCAVYRDGYESSIRSVAAITLTIPALVTYSVTYDANGGTNAPANQTKIYNQPLSLRSETPTRIGYTFNNWNTASDGSGTPPYEPGGEYITNENLILYAQWIPNTYTIIYDKNNNNATGTTANSTHTYDVPKQLTTNGYSAADYFFMGWATSSTGAVAYEDSQSVINLTTTGSKTLYAVWKYKFEAADIQTITAYRWNTSENIADDAGNAGKIQTYVIPGYKYSNVNDKVYCTTIIKASYRISGSTSAYEQLGNETSISAPSTLEWISGENIFDLSTQYDILITAQVVENNLTKITSTNNTFISVAEFILDFDNEGQSIGIFTTADGLANIVSGTNNGEKALRIQGDIVLYLDDSQQDTIDDKILTVITNRGWDVDAD